MLQLNKQPNRRRVTFNPMNSNKMTKSAAVTGGARGIGLAYAHAILSQGSGWKVALLDVAGETAAAEELCREFGENLAIGIRCDVGSEHSFRTAFEEVAHRLGPLSLFINNAGIVGALFFDADKQININLMGTIRGTEMALHAATAGLTRPADPPLDIICTASSNGLVPADSDCAPVYCATKFGIIGLVRSLAFTSSRFNVRVNAICPVTVETGMTAPYLPPEMRTFLDTDGRGGVLPPNACAEVLLRIINDRDPALAGEVFTVHPSVLPEGGRRVPLDTSATGPLGHLGQWRASDSAQVAKVLDETLAGVAKGEIPAWSSIIQQRK